MNYEQALAEVDRRDAEYAERLGRQHEVNQFYRRAHAIMLADWSGLDQEHRDWFVDNYRIGSGPPYEITSSSIDEHGARKIPVYEGYLQTNARYAQGEEERGHTPRMIKVYAKMRDGSINLVDIASSACADGCAACASIMASDRAAFDVDHAVDHATDEIETLDVRDRLKVMGQRLSLLEGRLSALENGAPKPAKKRPVTKRKK